MTDCHQYRSSGFFLIHARPHTRTLSLPDAEMRRRMHAESSSFVCLRMTDGDRQRDRIEGTDRDRARDKERRRQGRIRNDDDGRWCNVSHITTGAHDDGDRIGNRIALPRSSGASEGLPITRSIDALSRLTSVSAVE